MNGNGTRGRILVIGGGISGITAAVEASEAGAEVVLVEREAFVGGRVAALNEYFPKLCPPSCGLEINVRRIKTSPRIRVLTLSEVEKVTGEPGSYRATIRKNPRYVRDNCTACGACVDACPVERPDAYNLGMGTTRAVYLPHDMAYPFRFAIDDSVCPGESCGKCVPACPFDAIDLGMEPETLELDVSSVIWATGWSPPDAEKIEGLGFGTHPDIITNVMMERLAAPAGPTGGVIRKRSDGEPIRSIAFVQCAGSRDENYLRQCSGVCCMASLKQARYVRAQYPDADIYVFYIDIRAPGRLEDFYQASQEDEKLHLIKGKVAKVTPLPDGGIEVMAEDTLSGGRVHQAVDMVVLATGMAPVGAGGTEVEGGLRTDDFGFFTVEQPQAGLLAAGCARQPLDVAACVRDATGAALKALSFCGAGRESRGADAQAPAFSEAGRG